jgi:hypothetical protein
MISHVSIGNAGRFGNQMFQFAALLGVADKTGYDVKIPLENTRDDAFSFYDLSKQASEPTGMELRKPFDIPDSFFTSQNEVYETIKQRYQEPFFHFSPAVFDIPDNTDISGYFQSEKYFKHAEDIVRDLFTFRPEIRERAERELANIKDDAPRVSIHVRRGDYVANSGNHTVTGLNYYGEAISKFFYDKQYRFVVFSDDPEWCRDAFDGGYVVDINDSYTEMCMMSMCDHHIIANSSFSWWGAWLNPNPKKIVTAPSQWFGPNLKHNSILDLLPTEWFWV